MNQQQLSSCPQNPFKHGSQNWRLYERLKLGPITNYEIMKDMNMLNNTGRLSDIRAAIRGDGWQVVGESKGSGIWEYRITNSI